MHPIAEHKLDLLRQYIDAELSAWPQVQAVVAIGSVAQAVCRPDSDVDIYVFFHPTVDVAVMPAESLYTFSTGEYHSIFADETSVAPDGRFIQLDAKRVEMSLLDREAALAEGDRAQLAAGILVWDREGRVAPRLSTYVHYSNELRRTRLLDHLSWADYLLAERQIQKWIGRFGHLAAQDQLTTAAEHLIRALFAYNRHWEPYRSLWLEETCRLAWQPEGLRAILEEALVSQALTHEDLHRRLAKLHSFFGAIVARLAQDGFMPSEDASFWLFRQIHSELGYSYNMAEWRGAHIALRELDSRL